LLQTRRHRAVDQHTVRQRAGARKKTDHKRRVEDDRSCIDPFAKELIVQKRLDLGDIGVHTSYISLASIGELGVELMAHPGGGLLERGGGEGGGFFLNGVDGSDLDSAADETEDAYEERCDGEGVGNESD
jgi:hypothetical protein